MIIHDLLELLLVLNVLAIDGNNQIAAKHNGRVPPIGTLCATSQTGTLGCPAGQYALHQETIVGGKAELVRNIRTDGECVNAKDRTPHSTQRKQIVEHGLGG